MVEYLGSLLRKYPPVTRKCAAGTFVQGGWCTTYFTIANDASLVTTKCAAGTFRGVAQLVARTAGGREVAGSSPVTPTNYYVSISGYLSGVSK